MTEPIQSQSTASSPVSTGEALASLDDREFAEVVGAFWKRRGWTIDSVENPDTWYVDLALRRTWPTAQRALLRLKRPSSETTVGETELQAFVQAVEQSQVDHGTLVLPSATPRSAQREAEQFDVTVLGVEDLRRLVDRWGAHDLLAERVGRPVAPETEPVHERLPAPIVDVLERLDAVERVGGLVDRTLSPNPTAEEVSAVTFSGFRTLLSVSVVSFLLVLLAGVGSVVSWLFLSVFLLVTYVGLLPVMAADIYLVRRVEATEWTPTWWSLASFALAPLLFVWGALYWHRRRERTLRE